MLKKTITYEDLDGNPVTDEFHFFLSKAAIAEMELSEKGGLTDYIKKIVAEEDGKKLVEIFKDLLTRAVGRRSEDGKQFIRNQAIIDEFVQSNAYSELFVELATNAEQAAAFINGIVPKSMNSAVQTPQTDSVELPAVSDPEAPAWLKEGRAPTPDEVKNATPEQLQMAFRRKQNETGTTPVPPVA